MEFEGRADLLGHDAIARRINPDDAYRAAAAHSCSQAWASYTTAPSRSRLGMDDELQSRDREGAVTTSSGAAQPHTDARLLVGCGMVS